MSDLLMRRLYLVMIVMVPISIPMMSGAWLDWVAVAGVEAVIGFGHWYATRRRRYGFVAIRVAGSESRNSTVVRPSTFAESLLG